MDEIIIMIVDLILDRKDTLGDFKKIDKELKL